DAPASYSLDDKRQNFHFSTQSARVIRDGQLDGYVRGVSFQSLTPDFWGRCDLVADDWELHGFLSCAKGEPLQLMRVGHGAAHAIVAKAVGIVTMNSLEPSDLRRALTEAASLARASRPDDEWPGVADPEPIAAPSSFHEETAATTTEAQANSIGAVCAAVPK